MCKHANDMFQHAWAWCVTHVCLVQSGRFPYAFVPGTVGHVVLRLCAWRSSTCCLTQLCLAQMGRLTCTYVPPTSCLVSQIVLSILSYTRFFQLGRLSYTCVHHAAELRFGRCRVGVMQESQLSYTSCLSHFSSAGCPEHACVMRAICTWCNSQRCLTHVRLVSLDV